MPMSDKPTPTRDQPWLIRTYAGHSTAKKSNELYRTNLARGRHDCAAGCETRWWEGRGDGPGDRGQHHSDTDSSDDPRRRHHCERFWSRGDAHREDGGGGGEQE